jgi:hypothetical protein
VDYLCVVWAAAFGAYRRLYHPDFGRRDYIGSNISFSVPVLLPWLLLSGVLDLIHSLPLERLKRVLNTTEGQIAYFSIFLLGIAVMGPAMIKRFWRCTPLAQSPGRLRIEALCRRAGMAYADILHWPLFGGKMITAGVMGLVRKFRLHSRHAFAATCWRRRNSMRSSPRDRPHQENTSVLPLLFFAGYLLLSYVIYDLIIYAMIFAEPIWGPDPPQRTQPGHGGVGGFQRHDHGRLPVLSFRIRFFHAQFRAPGRRLCSPFDSARPLVSTLQKLR